MDYVGRVHMCETFQHLEHEVSYMVQGEFLLRVDHAMEIGLHQLGDDVDIVVAFAGLGF